MTIFRPLIFKNILDLVGMCWTLNRRTPSPPLTIFIVPSIGIRTLFSRLVLDELFAKAVILELIPHLLR